MIEINKYEKDEILKKYPDTTFVRTMRQDSKRHHYYVVETHKVVNLINVLRGNAQPKDNKRPKQHNTFNKKNNKYAPSNKRAAPNA